MGINGQSILQHCADEAKKWLVTNRKSDGSTERGILLAKFAHLICFALLRRMIDVERRLASVEHVKISKSLDVEAFESMTEMAERLQRLEADMADLQNTGFRYRGYWQQGKSAKRGDAYTHNGSIWWALRDTQETPDRDSNDWHVAVRKGKDAK
jgi:hypothetical protein